MVNWNDDSRPRIEWDNRPSEIKMELEAIRKLIEAILDAILLRKLEKIEEEED